MLTQKEIMLPSTYCNLGYMEIGERIQKAREARGLTPTELARRMKSEKGLSITPQALYQIESGGTKNPKPQTLLAIAEVLGVDIVFMISGIQQPAPALEAPSREAWDNAAELVRLYGMIDPELRPRAFRAARQVLIDVGRIHLDDGKKTNHG